MTREQQDAADQQLDKAIQAALERSLSEFGDFCEARGMRRPALFCVAVASFSDNRCAAGLWVVRQHNPQDPQAWRMFGRQVAGAGIIPEE